MPRGVRRDGFVAEWKVGCSSKRGIAMFGAIITQFLTGFSVVAILIIAALGLAIIFGVAGVINMAHGEFIMVGAYVAAVVGQLGGNTFLPIPPAFPAFRSLAPPLTPPPLPLRSTRPLH